MDSNTSKQAETESHALIEKSGAIIEERLEYDQETGSLLHVETEALRGIQAYDTEYRCTCGKDDFKSFEHAREHLSKQATNSKGEDE